MAVCMHRGFASSVIPWQIHGDGGNIGGQLSIGLIQFSLQYGHHYHSFLLKSKQCKASKVFYLGFMLHASDDARKLTWNGAIAATTAAAGHVLSRGQGEQAQQRGQGQQNPLHLASLLETPSGL